MGCTGPHTEGCRCRSAAFWEAYDVLKIVTTGLEKYMGRMEPHEIKKLRADIPCIEELRMITRKIGGFCR